MVTKQRILRSIRNAAISIVALLVLFVIAGVAYTWYMGQNSDQEAIASSVPVKTAPSNSTSLFNRPAPDKNAPVSVSNQSFTSKVSPGENASLMVKTLPGSKCQISVEYNDKPSTDSGLKTKQADEWGIVSWAWTVDAGAPLGEWPVEVDCQRNKKSAMLRVYLEVAAESED